MTVQNMTEQARISCGIPKKIAMINDIAGYGRCSTTVSLPIISAMGVQVCPVPTSVFPIIPAFRFILCTTAPLSCRSTWKNGRSWS